MDQENEGRQNDTGKRGVSLGAESIYMGQVRGELFP